MPATRTSSARPSTAHAESEPYPAQPGPFARTEGPHGPRRAHVARASREVNRTARLRTTCRTTLGAVLLEPLHLGEPQLRRHAHRAVVGGLGASTTGSSDARPQTSRMPLRMPRRRTSIPMPAAGTCSRDGPPRHPDPCDPTVCVGPVERDPPDHGPVEISHEEARPPPGHLRRRALELLTRRSTSVSLLDIVERSPSGLAVAGARGTLHHRAPLRPAAPWPPRFTYARTGGESRRSGSGRPRGGTGRAGGPGR